MKKIHIITGVLAVILSLQTPSVFAQTVTAESRTEANTRVESDGSGTRADGSVRTRSEVRADFQQWKDNFRKKHDQLKDKAQKVQARIDVLRDKSPEERCKYVRENGGEEQFRTRVKNFLEKSVDHLLQIQARVEANTDINDDAKAKIIAEIEADISWLREQISTIDDASCEEIVEILIKIHEHHGKYKKLVKRALGHHIQARVKHLLTKAENVLERFQNKVDELEEAGHDVTVLVEAETKFEAHLTVAEEKVTLALEQFTTAQTAENPAEHIRAGIEFAKEAQLEIQTGRRILHAAIKEFRAGFEN